MIGYVLRTKDIQYVPVYFVKCSTCLTGAVNPATEGGIAFLRSKSGIFDLTLNKSDRFETGYFSC